MTSPNPAARGRDPSDSVSIVGMACVFPDAPDLDTYWKNIVSGHDAIKEAPPERWDSEHYYSPASSPPSPEATVYCRRGGYLGPSISFDPSSWGIMPKAVAGGEPDHFLALDVAGRALADAGYAGGEVPSGESAEFILGRGNYPGVGMMALAQRVINIRQTLMILERLHPEYSSEDLEAIGRQLRAGIPPFHADNASSFIPNLSAGRAADRLNLKGRNFTIDAACASSLIAAEIGMRDLLIGSCDLALIGGIHVFTSVPFLAIFCSLRALSQTETISPFGAGADGTLPGEGCGIVVLKRTRDALRDGNRIYANLRSIGTSGDGRETSVLAPSVSGQVLAISRAYEQARIDPRTIGMIEAHGTATPIGDRVEIEALREVFGSGGAGPPRCALGTVKSMIGHAMPAAGIAGLIKAALAIHHKALPPTLHCDPPNPKLEIEKTPFYMSTSTRPWIHESGDHPRRAAVSAFGFGGVNAHAILEEAPAGEERSSSPSKPPVLQDDRNPAFSRAADNPLDWDTEAILIRGSTREAIHRRGGDLLRYLESTPPLRLADLAATLAAETGDGPLCLAIVASGLDDLKTKLSRGLTHLADPRRSRIKDRGGIYFSDDPPGSRRRVAFIYPGQGSPHPGMLSDLCLNFPEVREVFDSADKFVSAGAFGVLPSHDFFPPPVRGESENGGQGSAEPWSMAQTRAGVITGDWAMQQIVEGLQIQPDFLGGHSSGELMAMSAAGVFDPDEIFSRLPQFHDLDHHVANAADLPEARLLAVGAGLDKVQSLVGDLDGPIRVANDNCPHQIILGGPPDPILDLAQLLKKNGVYCEQLPFNRGYHTSMFSGAQGAIRKVFSSLTPHRARTALYSCRTGRPYPTEPESFLDLAVETWVRPVQFRRMIECMYADGARIFVEVGPGGVLTAFVEDILRNREHLAVSSNPARRTGVTGLNHLVGLLSAWGVPLRPEFLHARRRVRKLSLIAERDFPSENSRGTMDLSIAFPMISVPEQATTLAHAKFEVSKKSQGHADSEQAIQDHLESMDRFLQAQRGAMRDYFDNISQDREEGRQIIGGKAIREPALGSMPRSPAPHPSPPSFALVKEVLKREGDRGLEARHVLDLREAVYLEDHVFGHEVSKTDPSLRPLAVLPLTFGMEMMAEAACLLAGGQTPVEMKNIRALRWISVKEDQPVELTFHAERRPSGEIHVKVFGNAGRVEERKKANGPSALLGKASPVLEATVVFADRYPDAPRIESLKLEDERPPQYTARDFYDQRLTFHGPRFQSVSSIDAIGPDSVRGRLQALPKDRLLRADPDPNWVFDPILLDAVGQMISYWVQEYDPQKVIMFPAALARLRLFGPSPAVGEELNCRIRIRHVSRREFRGDITLVDDEGRVRLMIEGWMDWRFDMPDLHTRFWRWPDETVISPRWPAVEAFLAELEPESSFVCRRLEPFEGEDAALWNEVGLHLILNRRERRAREKMNLTGDQMWIWLGVQTIAKDAIRCWLRRRHGINVLPADVELIDLDGPRPRLEGPWLLQIDRPPQLAVAHTDVIGVAVAGEGPPLSLAIARLSDDDPKSDLPNLSAQARGFLEPLEPPDRKEWLTRFRCAAQAALKAQSRADSGDDPSACIESAEPSGAVDVHVLDAKTSAARRFKAHTLRDGEFVLGLCFFERELSTAS